MSNALILNGLKGKLDKIVEPDFSNPNWALEQAYNLGYKKGLTRLLKYVIIK